MSKLFLEQKNLRYTLTVIGADGKTIVDLGKWNGPEIELGSETGDGVDPEFGNYSTGGRQTAGEIELTRPWKRDRDRTVSALLKAGRGRLNGTLGVIELDDYGVATSSEPLDVYDVLVTGRKTPPANAAGDDAAEISVMVRIQP